MITCLRINYMKFILAIFSFLVFYSCQNNRISSNEAQIISQIYLLEFNRLKEGIDYYGRLGTDTKTISSIASNTIKELREHNSVISSKAQIVDYLETKFTSNNLYNDNLMDSLKANFTQFQNSEFTYIEELEYIRMVFEFGYWNAWSCTSFTIDDNNYYKLDTFEMEPNSVKTLKFTNPRLSHFEILSNSLQTKRPNELSIESGSRKSTITKVYYTYIGKNLVTHEKRKFKDSLYIKVK